MSTENEDQFRWDPSGPGCAVSLRRLLQLQESAISSQTPTKNGELMQRYLGFHMGLLGLEPKEQQATVKSNHSVSLAPADLSGWDSKTVIQLKVESLQVLQKLVKNVKKSRVFAFWYVFLPGCAFSPCKVGILELINHSDHTVREQALDLMMATFEGSTTHLLLANAHCRAGSFTPVCLDFALALGRMVRSNVNCMCAALRGGQPSHVSHTSRALIVLFEHLPFHRLESGLLNEVFQRLMKPSTAGPHSNPVILIAVLQVFAVIVSMSPPHAEVKSQFNCLFEWFLGLAFPKADFKGGVDNNIRYVSIQNLGLTAILDTNQFLTRIPMLQPLLEEAIREEKDQSVVIHVLRLLKTIGKCGNSLDGCDGETSKRLLHFWLAVLKPTLINSVEARECPVLKAALCNCVAEIGGTFSALPTDRRMLAVTLLLRLCRDPDHRTVTAATRGIGMLVANESLQNDVTFLTDSAEIMLEIFQESQMHQSVITSCTWALANLSDSLAKHHLQQEVDDFFPPHLVLELMKVAINMASASSMNVRSNSVRSLGSLIQCLNAMTKFVDLSDFKEVDELCEKAIDGILVNISSGKVMKVRWNACYAAGGVLKTNLLSQAAIDKIIKVLIPVMESCPNYKVRINAALALASVQDRQTFGSLYPASALSVIKSLESAVTNVEDSDEIQHRTDLIDQLCATYAYLITLAAQDDLSQLEGSLSEYIDLIHENVRSALLRISPEKATVFIEAKHHSMSLRKEGKTCTVFPVTIDAITI